MFTKRVGCGPESRDGFDDDNRRVYLDARTYRVLDLDASFREIGLTEERPIRMLKISRILRG